MEIRGFTLRYIMTAGAVAVTLFAMSLPPQSHAFGSCNQKNPPEFKDFSTTQMFSGRVHAPILATPLDRKHRTAIRESLANGVNFAGHYVVAEWGCGTGCREFVIVDVKTGIVYDPPFAEVDYHYPGPEQSDVEWWCYSDLLTYQKESALFVVEGCLQGKQCGRTYLVMRNTLQQKYYDPDLLPDGTIAPY
jgi:hypothetical protein